jgi:hypothetical protein
VVLAAVYVDLFLALDLEPPALLRQVFTDILNDQPAKPSDDP